MNNQEFIAKVYEILDAGRIEIDGKFYYSEQSVLDAMEWMKTYQQTILEVDTEKILSRLVTGLSNAITKEN